MMAKKPLLQLSNLGKRFGGNWAIKGVDLNVRQSDMIGIIGPNGAGKTTLFNMVTGFLQPTQGDVQFKGETITGHKPEKICHMGMARTFQIVKPFGQMSVLENVMIGVLKEESRITSAREKAKEYVDQVGLGAFRDVPAASLPIGNRKRLEVARALAARPELLLLDEVMGGLNDDETQEMMSLILALHKSGITIMLIEHNMQALMTLSQRVVVLCYGEKLAEGTPAEVSSNQQVINAYLGGND